MRPSELIINKDGSIYHLHLTPGDIPDTIILVGDLDRVGEISKHFSKITFKKQNREFVSHSGYYKNKQLMVMSTGIGTDNIDIVLNELDALANIDLISRTAHPVFRKLNLVRLGTTGAVQSSILPGTVLITRTVIGLDGLINFYSNRNSVCNTEFEKAFVTFTGWNPILSAPYVVDADPVLFSKLKNNFTGAITVTAPGFYGPQGRALRIYPADEKLNTKIQMFEYKGQRITNFEMETSAIYGLSRLFGHRAVTLCVVIANRITGEFLNDFRVPLENMIISALESLSAD